MHSVHLTTQGCYLLGSLWIDKDIQKISSNLSFAIIFNFSTSLGPSSSAYFDLQCVTFILQHSYIHTFFEKYSHNHYLAVLKYKIIVLFSGHNQLHKLKLKCVGIGWWDKHIVVLLRYKVTSLDCAGFMCTDEVMLFCCNFGFGIIHVNKRNTYFSYFKQLWKETDRLCLHA